MIAVNANQESGLLVDNAEEVLIEDDIVTSDSNLVVQLIDIPVKCPENDTVETNKEDVKNVVIKELVSANKFDSADVVRSSVVELTTCNCCNRFFTLFSVFSKSQLISIRKKCNLISHS